MKYNISWSGGKDSTATIILAHELKIPINEIIYCRVMYNEYIRENYPKLYNLSCDMVKMCEYDVSRLPNNWIKEVLK